MTDQNSERLLKVRQILRTMGCPYEMDSMSKIWCDDLWHLSLPDDKPDTVYLGFNPETAIDLVVDVSIRFTGDAVLHGLDVYHDETDFADLDSALTGSIGHIDDN